MKFPKVSVLEEYTPTWTWVQNLQWVRCRFKHQKPLSATMMFRITCNIISWRAFVFDSMAPNAQVHFRSSFSFQDQLFAHLFCHTFCLNLMYFDMVSQYLGVPPLKALNRKTFHTGKRWVKKINLFGHCWNVHSKEYSKVNPKLVGGVKYFLFSPLPGEDFQVD